MQQMGGQQQWAMGQIPAAHPGGGFQGMGHGGHAGMGHVHGSLSGSSASGSGTGGLVKGGSLQGGSGTGAISAGGSGNGGAAWSGHDDVSNLMRQVAHGGKYDPAFDFVADEFSKAGGKR
jgi:hypothetical protein